MSTTEPHKLQEEQSIDEDQQTVLDIEDDEKATLNADAASVDYKKLFEIKKQPCISMHTVFRSLDFASLIVLNILVVLYYDYTKFQRV